MRVITITKIVGDDACSTAECDRCSVAARADVRSPGNCLAETHDRADVRCASVNDELFNARYDVSAKHFETNRQIISAGLSLSLTLIGARHVGQSRDGLSTPASDCRTGGISSNRRQMSRRADRWEFAMKPKCRMRTNDLGSTCRRNRRMNSSAERVIFFCLLP